jgi:hypothetical protein
LRENSSNLNFVSFLVDRKGCLFLLANSGELGGKVGAKHSDRKSTVSAIGYARMLRPYRTQVDEDARF